MKAITLARESETPTNSAATSLSRTNRIERPRRLAKRLARKKKAIPVTTIVMSARHIELTVSTHAQKEKKTACQCGGLTAVGSCRPASPPVQEVKELMM